MKVWVVHCLDSAGNPAVRIFSSDAAATKWGVKNHEGEFWYVEEYDVHDSENEEEMR